MGVNHKTTPIAIHRLLRGITAPHCLAARIARANCRTPPLHVDFPPFRSHHDRHIKHTGQSAVCAISGPYRYAQPFTLHNSSPTNTFTYPSAFACVAAPHPLLRVSSSSHISMYLVSRSFTPLPVMNSTISSGPLGFLLRHIWLPSLYA